MPKPALDEMGKVATMKMTLGTETAHGFIRHKRVAFGDCIIDAPVMLERRTKRSVLSSRICGEWRPFPLKLKSGYVYALPGGGVIEGDR